jgi:signal transduction histidine kinase
MHLTNLAAFIVSLSVGCGVIYSNPKRSINRVFFLLSVNVALWALCLGWLTARPEIPNPVLWIRITSGIASFFPFLLWIVKACVKGDGLGWRILRKGWPWLLAALVMVALCFTPFFIPFESTREHPMRGVGWNVYAFVNAASYLILLVQAIYDFRSCAGIQKVELQTLIFGGAASGFLGILMMVIGGVWGIPQLSRSMPGVIVVFYSLTAWTITTQKVFDARDLFRTGLRTCVSIGVVAVIVWLTTTVDRAFIPRAAVTVFGAVVITIFFNRFNLRMLRATIVGGDKEAESIRASVLAAGRDEFDREVLIKRFSRILEIWGKSERAHFLSRENEAYADGNFRMPFASPETIELLKMRWATPESLQRQREAGGRKELFALMRKHDFGVMICAPSTDLLAPFVLALQTRRSGNPFTWPEVKRLNEWITIIENTLSRISLTQQARESEQLRTAGLLGASLAHEIRNPLVTLKTIAQSAKTRYNDPEFRRLLIELVPAEIERIEGLVTGLMDLGRPQYPHYECIGLNEVVETSAKLVRPKALDELVKLTTVLEASPDSINADRSSLRQIILNLVMNAIQAVTAIEGVREVTVRTFNGDGSVVLEVADNGPGIPDEVREKLFQPFTTSNKTSGIGLGLAITADLVKLHQGKITLVAGGKGGTTFRVTLPCQQHSS